MKNLLKIITGSLLGVLLFASMAEAGLPVYGPYQIGTGTPAFGSVLVSQGTSSTSTPLAQWMPTSTLGFIGGGITNAYASSTFPSFGYASSTFSTYQYGSSTYYFSSNPSSYISNATGLLSAGTNVTLTGAGTLGSPYVINSSGGGGGSSSNIAAFFVATSTSGVSTFAGNLTVGAGTNASNNSLSVGYTSGASTSISGTGYGSFANGYALNVGAKASITSSGYGSFAMGQALGIGVAAAITSSNQGSFAGGDDEGGQPITASGDASFAFGQNVSAVNTLSTAFGSGFSNNIANSFMVGYGATPAFTVNGSSVGIGSTTPSSLFTVGGDGFFTGTSTASRFIANSTTSTSTFAGAVDVGTTTPTNRFAIQATAASTVPFGIYNASGSLAASISIASGQGSSLNMYQSGTQAVQVTPVTGSANYFNNSGNFGIGTTTPGQKLDIWGNLNVATSSTPTLFASPALGEVGIGTNAPLANLDIRASTVGGTGFLLLDPVSNQARWSMVGNGSPTTRYILSARNSVGTTTVSFDPGGSTNSDYLLGNVGIGTTTPVAKLDVYANAGTAAAFNVSSNNYLSMFSVAASGSVTQANGSAYAGQAMCYATGGVLGHCTSVVGATGACTCVGN